MRRILVLLSVAALLGAGAADAATPAQRADTALDRALRGLVQMRDGPPGVIALVQRGDRPEVHAFGVADVQSKRRPRATDHMRVASVAKAYSGAIALSLVTKGILSLDDTIGQRLPDLPAAWHAVTLRQLLNHTSGVPDFTDSVAFGQAVVASLTVAPPPAELLEFVKDEPLNFQPGSEFRYSNSDNIVVGLMVEAATGHSYEDELREQVTEPLGLSQTSLPRGTELPSPYIHGYDLEPDGAPEDVSTIFASGWAWASGGIVSTPAELNEFIRADVGGRLFGPEARAEQLMFVPGHSEPPGPGRNTAGLALFRYDTRCGTVYGHTGNTFGFTQFAAASPDGRRSVTVSINLQRTQKTEGQAAAKVFRKLRRAELLAVCAALAG